MKLNRFLFTVVCSITVLASCNKIEVSTPDDFNVTIEKLTYKVNDTVKFNLTGNPGTLVFYSGEVGRKYENKDRQSFAGVAKLSFQSSMQQGLLNNGDELRLLISTNLIGYDAAAINAATWTDITSRNTKWPTTLSTAFTASDAIDISDFNSADKINIAFRFLGKKNPASAQRRWQIQNLALSNQTPDGKITPLFSAPFLGGVSAIPASTFAFTGWVQASLKNNNFPGTAANAYVGYNAWNVGTANISTRDSVRNSNGIPIRTAYPITFDPGPTVDNDDNDDWLITTATDLKRTNSDGGDVIKTYLNIAPASYNYIYKTPGTYQITFVAINNSISDKKEVIKKLEVTVTP